MQHLIESFRNFRALPTEQKFTAAKGLVFAAAVVYLILGAHYSIPKPGEYYYSAEARNDLSQLVEAVR